MKDAFGRALDTFADEVRPVDLYQAALQTSRRLRVRRAVVASLATAVALAGLVAGSLALVPTSHRVAPPAAPTPSSSPDPAAVDTLGLGVLGDNAIWQPDTGRTFGLKLPAGVSAVAATRVPGGWVLTTDESGGRQFSGPGGGRGVWFTDGNTPKRISGMSGNYAISPDGRILVIADTGVNVYELPSLNPVAYAEWSPNTGPLVFDVSEDTAVLRGANGEPGPNEAAVWNFRTGQLITTGGSTVWLFDAHNGYALRRVDQMRGTGKSATIVKSCVDVVRVTDRLPLGFTGLCGAVVTKMIGGRLSPDRTWAVMSYLGDPGPGGDTLVSVGDLRAGRWKPRSGPMPQIWGWVAGGYLVKADDTVPQWQTCSFSGQCRTLKLPPLAPSADLPSPELIPRVG